MSMTLPPVPQRLREMLKDYPEHIQRLREVLNRIVEAPSHGVDPFDRAIWLLEGRLETFIAEAREELKAAEACGDEEAVEAAKAKEAVMFRARSPNGGLADLDDLFAYCRGSLEK
ncbi:MAG: hypothetical protein ACOY37_08540 [Pseudomonadota bacterium]